MEEAEFIQCKRTNLTSRADAALMTRGFAPGVCETQTPGAQLFWGRLRFWCSEARYPLAHVEAGEAGVGSRFVANFDS